MTHFFSPALDGFRIGLQIGHALRDGFRRCLENPGQAEQRTMDIEHGKRSLMVDNLNWAQGRLQKAFERRLTLDDDVAAAGHEQRNIANELDRVAEALLRM